MSLDASQVFVLNEYNKRQEFYKLFTAEKKIRCIATGMKNSYLLSIFACCRELFKLDKHCRCIFAESKKEAKKLLKAKDEKQKQKAEEAEEMKR